MEAADSQEDLLRSYREVIEGANSIILRWDKQGTILYMNPFGLQLFGFTAEELFGRNVMETIVSPSSLEGKDLDAMIKAILESPESFAKNENENICKDGRRVWINWTNKAVLDDSGTYVQILSIGNDVTERKRAEEALRQSEMRYRSLVESTSDWVWATDKRGYYTYASPKVKEFIGYEPKEIIGRKPLDFVPQHDARRFMDVFGCITGLQKAFDGFEKINLHKNGELITLESSGVPVFDEDGNFDGYRGIDRDITGRKQMERQLSEYRNHLEELVVRRTKELSVLNEQLQQSQKMEAVGLLAGWIAHDFNNILTTIKGSIHIIMKKLQPDNPVLKYAQQITSSVNKASSLSQDLLAFSRKQTIALRPVDFNGIVHKAAEMLSQLIGEHIELAILLNGGNVTVMADKNQIEQVLLNLATNARDAMPDGGVLTLRTDLMEMDEQFKKEHGFGVSGKYVLLTVSDTGVGMEGEAKGKIFEPFFTTKALGKGSGLGLAVTYGIVKQHNGFIDVETAPGEGSTFRIYLPGAEAGAVHTEGLPAGGDIKEDTRGAG